MTSRQMFGPDKTPSYGQCATCTRKLLPYEMARTPSDPRIDCGGQCQACYEKTTARFASMSDKKRYSKK